MADQGQWKVHPSRTSRKMTGFRTALGLHPLAPIDETHDTAEHQDLLWSRIPLSASLSPSFLELWCWFCSAMAALPRSASRNTSAPGGNGFGDYQSISWGWGLGVVGFGSTESQTLFALTTNYRCEETVVFLFTVKVVATVPPMVSDLQTDVEEIVGWLIPVKFASPIIASVVDDGTPAVQLLAVDQLVLVVPFQLVCAVNCVMEKMKRMIANKDKYSCLIKIWIWISEITSFPKSFLIQIMFKRKI